MSTNDDIDLRRSQIETAIDNATIGIAEVEARPLPGGGGKIRMVIDVDEPIRFLTDDPVISSEVQDEDGETINEAIETWFRVADFTTISDELIEGVNERREALNERWRLDIDPLKRPDDEPFEGFPESEEERRDIADGEVLELPIVVEEFIEDRFVYAPPPRSVSLEVADEIAQRVRNQAGDADQFDANTLVGIALVTDRPDPRTRELVSVEVLPQFLVEPEAPPEEAPEVSDGIEEPTASGISAAELEDFIEQSTVMATIDVQINPDADSIRGTFGVRSSIPSELEGIIISRDLEGQLVTGATNAPADFISEALEIWEEFVDLRTVPEEELITLENRRDNIEVELRDRLNESITIPSIGQAIEGEVEVGESELEEVVDRFEAFREGADLTEFEPDELIEQEGFSLPVDVDVEIAEEIGQATRADLEPGEIEAEGEIAEMLETQREMQAAKQVEQGLQVHFVEDVADEVHAVFAKVLDSTPENLFRPKNPSDLSNFDFVRTFTLRRDEAGQPWTTPRFQPSELINRLEPFDAGNIKVVALATPLK